MKVSIQRIAFLALLTLLLAPVGPAAVAVEVAYPQNIRIRYEAEDPRTGGHFIIWVEREKLWYGLDQRLYPSAKSVEISHITPTPGSPAVTLVEVTSINSQTPDYFHFTGNVRVKVTGMRIKASNNQ